MIINDVNSIMRWQTGNVLYRLAESDFMRKKAVSMVSPDYYAARNTRIAYVKFDLRLDGGKTYKITVTSTYNTAQMGLAVYNQNVLDAVAQGINYSSYDNYDPGWQSLTTTIAFPAQKNGSPIRGVRFNFRQSTSNPTIANDFKITELTIEEVT